eukprot:8072436-Pyramimonas_sp.AAC.1
MKRRSISAVAAREAKVAGLLAEAHAGRAVSDASQTEPVAEPPRPELSAASGPQKKEPAQTAQERKA